MMLHARRLLGGVHAHGRMGVHEPAAVGDRVVEAVRPEDVVLGQAVGTVEAPRLTFARDGADPFQTPVGGLGKFAGVLDVIPHAERDAQELVADLGVVLEGVELPAPLKPPVAVFKALDRTQLEILLAETAHPRGAHEGLRRVVPAAGQENGAAQRLAIGDLLSERLVVIVPGLAADVIVGPRLGPEAAIARAIGEKPRRDDKLVLGGVPDRPRAAHHAVDHLHRHQIGVEQQADVGLEYHLFVEQQIPLRIHAGGVAGGVLQPQLLDDAGLARAGLGAVAIGPDHVHLDLAGRVAAQHGAVLDQHHAGAVAGGGQRGADPGQAAAGHEQIGFETMD